jgi:hypothetical protein
MNLSTRCKITKVLDYTGTATSAVNTTAVDMAGWDGVLFLGCIHSYNATNTVNAASETTSGGTYADLLGTSINPTANNQAFWLEIYKPLEQFVRLEFVRSGATTTLGEVWAIQYEGAVSPADNLTTNTYIGELHISPIEGTA